MNSDFHAIGVDVGVDGERIPICFTVASSDDHRGSAEGVKHLSWPWGSGYHCIGGYGRISTCRGFGDWLAG